MEGATDTEVAVRWPIGWAAVVIAATAVLPAAAAAPAVVAAGRPLAVQLSPIPRELIVPGDLVQLRYAATATGPVSGTLYVRNDLRPTFAPIAMTRTVRGNQQFLAAVLPPQLIRGSELFYYAVVRDPATRRSVTVRSGGRAWILERPNVVRLGVHTFGHVRAPDAVVARAAPADVGWQTEGDTFGPQTFLVGPDRSVWLDDGINNRLLAWRPGHPNAVARSVRLGAGTADNDVALGRGNTFYVTGGVPHPPRLLLYRLDSSGAPLWHSTLVDPFQSLGANTALRLGPDGTVYAVAGRPGSLGGQQAWVPVATPAGQPLSAPAQRAGIHIGQPLPRRMRLVTVSMFRCGCGEPTRGETPLELRFALIDRNGRVARAWRVLSRTPIALGTMTPALVGGDPVVQLDVTRGTPGRDFQLEYLVLRLRRNGGTPVRFSLRRAVYGDNLLADLRVGPDGALYQLASAPTTGVTISRFSLR